MKKFIAILLPVLLVMVLLFSLSNRIESFYADINRHSIENLHERTEMLAVAFPKMSIHDIKRSINIINKYKGKYVNFIELSKDGHIKPFVYHYLSTDFDKIEKTWKVDLAEKDEGCKSYNHVIDLTDVCWQKISLISGQQGYLVYANRRMQIAENIELKLSIYVGILALIVVIQAIVVDWLVFNKKKL